MWFFWKYITLLSPPIRRIFADARNENDLYIVGNTFT